MDLLLLGATFEIVSEVLGNYRLHTDSITSTDKLSSLRAEWANGRFSTITKKDISEKVYFFLYSFDTFVKFSTLETLMKPFFTANN